MKIPKEKDCNEVENYFLALQEIMLDLDSV